MKTVHILSQGFVATNVRAMLFPLIVWRQALRERGISWRVFTEPCEALFDCDVLVVESHFHGKRWGTDTKGILEELWGYAQRVDSLFYLDSSDSTALLHPEVLPIVDRYYKGQILKNRRLYGTAHYGNRFFTDFVHETYGTTDDNPSRSIPVVDDMHLNKIRVWWNSSLADWSWKGRYRMALYSLLPWSPILAFPNHFTDPAGARNIKISCRMGTVYDRATVAWPRKIAKEKLEKWAPANRISYREYVRELQAARLVISPFGWGEINYKDYEVFLAGAALVKPDMEHLETWPNLYRPDDTYFAYDWSGENLAQIVESLLDDAGRAEAIARKGQDLYKSHLVGSHARSKFCDRVQNLLE